VFSWCKVSGSGRALVQCKKSLETAPRCHKNASADIRQRPNRSLLPRRPLSVARSSA